MVEADLLRLAEAGILAFPPASFEELAISCRQAGGTRPRLLVIAESINLMAAAWEPHEAFWTESTLRLDGILAADLAMILGEPDEGAALSLAASMREAVALVLASSPPI